MRFVTGFTASGPGLFPVPVLMLEVELVAPSITVTSPLLTLLLLSVT